jgi:hypothetical protein
MPVDPTPVRRPRPPVALRIPADALISLLRLDPTEHTIVGATIRKFAGMELIELSIDAPNAPPGSVEMLPNYHHSGRPDPISMTSVTWVDIDGLRLTQDLAPKLPTPAGDDGSAAAGP